MPARQFDNMDVQGIQSGLAFSRNPIILRRDFPVDNPATAEGSFYIRYGDKVIFNGRFTSPLYLNIAEIVDAAVEYFPEPDTVSLYPIKLIEDTGTLAARNLYACFEFPGYEDDFVCQVIPGGISRQNYRQLLKLGKDIFQTRFFRADNNFFLTTRTNRWLVVIKETELYPLYFFARAVNGKISVVEAVSGATFTEAGLDGVAALDVAALRRYFALNNDVIPSVFDVFVDSKAVCRIVVEHSAPTKERYRLKFRNSLGVFEIIELTGSLSISPEYPDADSSQFQHYDSVTDEYFTERERIERRQSITVGTGAKNPDETRFLMDMAASDEVYLLDLAPDPIKVIPSIEEFTYSPWPETPQKFSIKLKIAGSDYNILPDLLDGNEGHKPRIFSKEFSKQFN